MNEAQAGVDAGKEFPGSRAGRFRNELCYLRRSKTTKQTSPGS